MIYPNGPIIDDTNNNYHIVVDKKDNMQSIERKLESISTKNKNMLDEILTRENTSIIIGYDYALQCTLPNNNTSPENKSDWEMKTIPKMQHVGIIIHQWRYNGVTLEQPEEDLCNDCIKYSLTKFCDLKRLNHEVASTAMKYLKFLRDTQEIRQILQICLNNLHTVNNAIQEVNKLTQNQKDIADDIEIQNGMADILKGFDILNRKLPGTTVNLNSKGFAGVSSDVKPESIFKLDEGHSLIEIDKMIETAGKINQHKLDEISLRSNETISVGYKYSISCDLPNNKYKGLPDNQLCRIKTSTKAQKVCRTLENWKYEGRSLEKTDVMSKDGIDFTLENYSDLPRLNNDIVKVGRKSASCLADKTETRKILQVILSNLELINKTIIQLEILTARHLDTVNENEKVTNGLQAIVDGFHAVEGNTGSAKLVLNASGFIGFFSENTVCCEPDIDKIVHKHAFHPHTSNVDALQCYTENGLKYLVSGSYDKTVRIWNLEKSQTESILDISTVSAQIYALAFFDINGITVMACGGYGCDGIDVWNLSSNKVEYTLEGHSCTIHALTSIEQNEQPYLISGSGDKTIKIWDLLTKVCIGTLEGHFSNISSLAVYNDKEDKNVLVSGSGDGTIKLWDIQAKSLVTTLEGHSSHIFTVVTFTKEDGPYLASGSQDTTIKIWNLTNHTLETTLTGDSSWVWTLTTCIIQDSPHLASGGYDGIIRLWDLTNYNLVKTLEVPDTIPIRSLTTYHENDTETWYLVSGHNDGSIMLWSSE